MIAGEDEISTFKEGGEQYRVTMRLLPEQRDDPAVLAACWSLRAKLGLIRLDGVARLERGLGPGRIDRYNRQFAVGIYGNIAPGYPARHAPRPREARDPARLGLPPGYRLPFSGQVQDARRDHHAT